MNKCINSQLHSKDSKEMEIPLQMLSIVNEVCDQSAINNKMNTSCAVIFASLVKVHYLDVE